MEIIRRSQQSIFTLYYSPLRGHVSVLDDSVVQVPVEGLLDGGHVLHVSDLPHRYRPPPVHVRHWGTHCVPCRICNIEMCITLGHHDDIIDCDPITIMKCGWN